MKAMDDNISTGGNSNSIGNNWLGFSLSPNMKMEVAVASASDHHHSNQYQQQQPTLHHSLAVPTSFYLPSAASPHFNTSSTPSGGICYGLDDENNNGSSSSSFHSSLSVMPLKSDGTLCIMEALSKSQPHEGGMVPSPSPKLEDFLGGATMGAHQYNSHEREAMFLSLDSIYSHQDQQEPGPNRQHSLDHNSSHQHFSVQTTHPFYSGIPSSCQGIFHSQLDDQHHHVHPEANNWPLNRLYYPSSIPPPTHASLEQQINNNNGGMVDQDGGEPINGAMGSCGGELQSLSLSMSPGSQSSSCVTASRQISPPTATTNESMAIETATKKRALPKVGQKQPVHRKSIDTFGQRTSQYRGVTRHRWTGRYEAHLWDNSCKKEGQTRKGRQVYLGGYDMEEKAARAYDLAALKYWGPSTHINFPLENYRDQLEEMKNMSRQEYVAHLRRKSSGFSRGASIYRGVTRHHQHGRWQARIGRVAGNKDLYLGTFSTQEEAAEAYDVAAIKFRGANAVTNFDITRYDVERIIASNTLLAGELARRNKDTGLIITEANEYNPPARSKVGECIQVESCNDNALALYQSPQRQQNSFCSPFLASMHDLIGTDQNVNAGQQAIDESTIKLGNYSNQSSLVSSLSSSREASPDRAAGATMLFAKPPMASKFINGPANGVSVASWFQSAQLRPSAAIPVAHLPVFASWNDT